MARKLIVMPDDTIEPILAAIGAAAKSLKVITRGRPTYEVQRISTF